MAEVTEMSANSPTMPPPNGTEPPTEPRKRGRPLGSTKKVVAPEPEEPAEAEFTGNADFWLMLANFSDDDWKYLVAYLYRLAPKIDRKANGRAANLQAYTSAFTQNDIMLEHGSGAYQIYLNQISRTTGKAERIAIEKISIMNPKYPPNVPAGDWVDAKENEMWKWGVGPEQIAAIGGGSAGYPPGFNVAQIMDKADERALRMVEIMSPKEDGKLETVLTAMIQMNSPERLIALVQAIAPKQDNTMLTMLLEDRKADREKMDRLQERMNQPAPPQKNIVEQFIELKPAIAELIPLFSGRGGKTDIWADIAKEAIGQLPDVITLARDAFAKKEPQQQQQQTRQLAASTSTATTELAAKPVDQMNEDEKKQYVDQLWKKWGSHLLGISSRLVEDFKVRDQGYWFRDWYVEMYGKLRWADMKRELPPELVTNMYFAHPQLQVELAPPERLNLFLVQFFTNFGEETDVVVEDEPPPVEQVSDPSAAQHGEAKPKRTRAAKGAH